MLTRRALLAALWIAAATAFPALAIVEPVVDRALERVPDQPVFTVPNTPAPNNPSPIKADPAAAKRFDDGRVCPREAAIDRGPVTCCTAPPAQQRPVGWWKRGPVRRWISSRRGFRIFRRWGRC